LNYWLLTTEYPPFHGGGISTYCYFTAHMLAEAGHFITVIISDDGIDNYRITEEIPGIRLVRFNSDRNGLRSCLGYTARLSYAFADMVRVMVSREGKPDYIEAQDYQGIAYYLIQFKHLGTSFVQEVPILITLHSPAFVYLDYNRVPTYRFPEFWTCEMEKHSIIGADCLISPTAFLVKEIQQYLDISHREISVLPNPYRAETARTRTLSAPEGTMGKTVPAFVRNKIIFYGKLSPQKGSFELLNYFRELWDEGFEHPLHIVGGTDIVYHPERQTMGQLVKKQYAAYLDRGLLKMHGRIKPADLEAWLSDAHVIIVPSIVDNLPYVVMEAMQLGKVVLASNQGGQREMMEHGVSGFIFDHGDRGSFRRELEKILAFSREEIERIGLKARKWVEGQYSFETVGPAKLNLLKAIRPLPASSFPFVFQEERKELPALGDPGLLSVVIPYYNMGRYLLECLQSVQESSYRSLEILILNDGSTDPFSLDQLTQAALQPNTRVINQKNRGLAETRNAGAKAARGEFMALLDADDQVSETYFEKAVQALRKNDNVFFAGAWVQYFENSRAVWPTHTPQPPYALVHNPVNSSGLIYKRAAFLAGGLNDKKVDYGLEDYESVINMLHNGYNGVVIPEILFRYRVRSGSMIRQLTLEKQLYSYKYIAEKHADYYAKFAAQVVNLLNSNGPGYSFDNPTEANHPILKRKLFYHGANFIRTMSRKNPRIKRMVLSIASVFIKSKKIF
jgi:glycosyltransferase involved in cell wall biosynthesis